MKITDEMVEKALSEFWHGDKEGNRTYGEDMRSALEAALSTDAEPVAFVVRHDLENGGGSFCDERNGVIQDHLGHWQNADVALYAEPVKTAQAAAVKVKPLEWKDGSPGSYTEIAESPFGHYSVWEINGTGCWAPWKQGSGSIVDGGLAGAKAAAQSDYEARIRSALA